MHATATRHPLHGRFRHVGHALCRFVGINPRRCFCMRCIAARSGVYRRTRMTIGQRAYADVRVLGIRISHRYAFDVPLTSPPSVICAAGDVAGAGHGVRLLDLEAFKGQDHVIPGGAAVRSRQRLAASI